MKAIAAAAVLGMIGLVAHAESQLKAEPKELILSIDAESAKTVCPQPGQVVTIKITTTSGTRDVVINPRAKGAKDIDPSVKNFSVHIRNKGGQLALMGGVSLEISTADGKKYGPKDMAIPAGTRGDLVEIICTYYGDPGQEWDFKPWVD